jgi:hypothetical protein
MGQGGRLGTTEPEPVEVVGAGGSACEGCVFAGRVRGDRGEDEVFEPLVRAEAVGRTERAEVGAGGSEEKAEGKSQKAEGGKAAE